MGPRVIVLFADKPDWELAWRENKFIVSRTHIQTAGATSNTIDYRYRTVRNSKRRGCAGRAGTWRILVLLCF